MAQKKQRSLLERALDFVNPFDDTMDKFNEAMETRSEGHSPSSAMGITSEQQAKLERQRADMDEYIAGRDANPDTRRVQALEPTERRRRSGEGAKRRRPAPSRANRKNATARRYARNSRGPAASITETPKARGASPRKRKANSKSIADIPQASRRQASAGRRGDNAKARGQGASKSRKRAVAKRRSGGGRAGSDTGSTTQSQRFRSTKRKQGALRSR